MLETVKMQTTIKVASGNIVISRYAVGLPMTAFHVISAVAMNIPEYNRRTSSRDTHIPMQRNIRSSSRRRVNPRDP